MKKTQYENVRQINVKRMQKDGSKVNYVSICGKQFICCRNCLIKLLIIFFEMKKYQLWLERKSYSQHLANLMKIKFERTSPELNKTNLNAFSRLREQSIKKYKYIEDYKAEADKAGDVAYSIPFKQLRNRKLRLMKTFQLLNQNISMARRIKDAKSVVGNIKEKSSTVYDQRKAFQKKCEISNEQIRSENFKKFLLIQNQRVIQSLHKYHLTVEIIHNFNNLCTRAEFGQIECEILGSKHVIKSQFIKYNSKQTSHQFYFPLEIELPHNFQIRLSFSKGLEVEQLALFTFSRPNAGEMQEKVGLSHKQENMKVKLKYQKIKKYKNQLKLR